MSDLQLSIAAVGISAPGLPRWETAAPVLRGACAVDPADYVFAPPQRLPRNERRRSTRTTRLAFAACEDALVSGAVETVAMRSVFASCSGDMDIIGDICRKLTQTPIALSPMQFHNSVHNSAAGYWSIASEAHDESISLSSYDYSFAAGLLETALILQDQPDRPVLFCCYDVDTTPPINTARPVPQPFACALICTQPRSSLGNLSLQLNPDAAISQCGDAELDVMRQGNPAARALPLLQALARRDDTTLGFEMANGQMLQTQLNFSDD